MSKVKSLFVLACLSAAAVLAYQNCAEAPKTQMRLVSTDGSNDIEEQVLCDGVAYFNTSTTCLASTDCGLSNQACSRNTSGCFYCSYRPSTCNPGEHEGLIQCRNATVCGALPNPNPEGIEDCVYGSSANCYTCNMVPPITCTAPAYATIGQCQSATLCSTSCELIGRCFECPSPTPNPSPGNCSPPRYTTIHQCHAGTPCGVPTAGSNLVRCQETGGCFECVQPQPPESEIIFSRSGMFFKPSCSGPSYDGNNCLKRFDISKPLGITYKKISVDLDFKMGDWFAPDKEGMHNLFWLHRSHPWTRNVIGYVNLRGPNRNILHATHWINSGNDTIAYKGDFIASQLVKGNTYHLYYEVSAQTASTLTRITRSDGSVVATASGAYTGGGIATVSPGFFIEFAHTYAKYCSSPTACGGGYGPNGCSIGSRCGPEVPSLGFEYSNITIKGWHQ